MIIALLVTMFIVLVVLYNVIDKIKEITEALGYVIDCNFKNDLGIKGLEKTVEELADDVWVSQILGDFAERQINELEEKIEKIGELELIIGATNIKADDIKTGTIPKSCSIDGKCN